MATLRRRFASLRSDDGLGLVEVMVTMLIISISLLGLMAMQARAYSGVGLAGQREQATQLANRLIEQARSQPYATIKLGLRTTDLSGDANVTGTTFRPAYANGTISEPLVTSTTQASAPFFPHTQAAGTTKIGPVQYTARLYVSTPAAAVSPGGYWLTAIVTWSSAATKGATETTAVRSLVYDPSAP